MGGSWGLAGAGTAAATPGAFDDPVGNSEPYAVSGPWQVHSAHVYGSWPAGPPGSWSSPVVNFKVSAPYGVRGGWAAGHHTGIDLAVPVGTPVRSVGAGTVVFSGSSGSYGKVITVRMADGKYTLFAHLSKRHVGKGDRVKAGTVLGKSGNTGRSTGPHLHFEVRTKRSYGSDINPVAYLAERGVHIL
ncbi:M23 family peptidase [Streptomyces armeniacus]|uniref:M23 family peptidase n=1 Tax=Streptomyces armeniacus TaxID=83291 RepID=A0A345XNP1_9ACTN|nr:M23 family metallopeptidase [Streptomyces armeniacus]AXK33257.1 M23 family peptidase [Streptomyces armeniacus]